MAGTGASILAGTVTAVAPVRVRVDGAVSASAVDTLAGAQLSVGMRVRLAAVGRSLLVLDVGSPSGGAHADSDHNDAFSLLSHNHPAHPDADHDDRFSLLAHGHPAHADTDHDDRFALIHSHPYAATVHVHDEYATDSELESRRAIQLAQHLILPPGHSPNSSATLAVWSGTHLKWGGRILILAAGRGSHFASPGYYEMLVPATGTVITGYSGALNQTVTADGIPINSHVSLFAELTIGGTGVTYKLVGYGSNYVIPANWFLVASCTENDKYLRTGWGETLDYWRAPVFVNGWGLHTHGDSWEQPAYRREGNRVVFRGGMMGGGVGQSTTAIDLPGGYRPPKNVFFWAVAESPPTPVRIDITAGGSLIQRSGPNTHTSLDGISFAI